MNPALPTLDEPLRIESLRQYDVLDTPPEPELDELTALAAEICGTPIALVSLIDVDRQWFKSKIGIDAIETPRSVSFCDHAIHQQGLFIVSDATKDERFAHNPLVTGEPGIRFYAGMPLVSRENMMLGTLCVVDRVPRTLSRSQERALGVVARQVMTHLDARRRTRELAESEARFRLLAENITDAFWIGSPDLEKILYVSPGYERIWGHLAEEIYVNPHQWSECIVPEDRARVLQAFARLKEREPTMSVEYRIARPDGAIRWLYARGFQVRDRAGRLTSLTGIVADITERKHTELATRHLAALVEFSDDAIIGEDLNSVVTSWNKGAETIFGFSAGEIVGTSVMRLIPADRRDEENQILEKIRRGESVHHFETVRQTKSELQINVSVTVSSIRDSTGKIIGVSKVARDITQRKQAEEARRASEERYRSLFEYAPDGIVNANPESYYIDANPSMCRMLGYTRDELIGMHASDIVARNEVQEISPAFCEIKAGADYRREWHLLRKDGSIFSADVMATLMPDGNLLSMIRDVTARKMAEDRIAEQAALLEKARDAIVVRDIEGTILFWNNGAERIYGWARQEVVGWNVGEFLYVDRKRFEYANGLVVSDGEWFGELQGITRDKREINIEAHWTLIRDNEGRPKSVLSINTDVTEKKKLEAQFMRAQRMESIGTLAGGIAHDLNNILAPIILSIDYLKNISSNPQAEKILDTIGLSARRGADVVRQVLSFARGMEDQKVDIQIKHLLKDLEIIIKDTFPKNIRLHFSAPAGTWTLLGDRTHIHQILLNLCVNARDAMPVGGSLSISVENCVVDESFAAMNLNARAGNYVVVKVADSGTGIPPQLLDRIFEPFFTTKELNKGTGLGLSTVMAVAKSHGGFVNVESEVGKGTTFRVYLPASKTSSEALQQPPEEAVLPRGKGEMVLVVDDESSILIVTSQTLQAFGYRVLTATDGADALATYVQHKDEIAVVLTDMMMPVMDGAATIQALTCINPAVKIIAVSGLDSNAELAKISGGKAKHFLSKPYTAESLLRLLRTILDEA